jgi:AraC-like DNA-binding protein
MRGSEHYHHGLFDSVAPSGRGASLSPNPPGWPEVPLADGTSTDLSVVAAQLFEAAHKARNGDREATGAHIARAAALLQQQRGLGPSATPPVALAETRVPAAGLLAWQARKVRNYIDSHISGSVRVADLCALIQRSEAHFSRTFRCTFGVSPHAFLLRRRVELAAQCMLQTDAPLSQIALRCGFTDQAHLCKAFRHATGQSPASWRRVRKARDKGNAGEPSSSENCSAGHAAPPVS